MSSARNTSFGSPAFGQCTQASGGLFGQTSTGTTSWGGLFDGDGTAFEAQQQNAGFRTPTASGGLFGAKTTASSLIGTPVPTSSSFAFGFGQNTAGNTSFGSPAFGQCTPASGGLFGQTSTGTTSWGGLFDGDGTAFGAQQQNAGFRTPTASGGLFGAKTTASSLIGTPAQASSSFAFGFGQNTGNTSFWSPAFGECTRASGGLFGQTSTGTTSWGGLFDGDGTAFGAQQQNAGFRTPTASGGLFGAKTTASSLFGTPAPASSSFAFGFGQNTAGNTSFGSPAFGECTPASGGLFGQTSTGTTSWGGLFDGDGTAFGAQQQNAGFRTPTASGGLFGAKTTASSLIGTPAPASSSFAFGFGQNTGNSSFWSPAFGECTPASGGLFGQTSTGTTSWGGLFDGDGTAFGAQQQNAGFTTPTASGGLFGAKTTASSLFGTPAQASSSFAFGFGQNTEEESGTTIKFNPVIKRDTVVKNGVSTNLITKHQCITAMLEFESKSLEELRMEYYAANRKGNQVGTSFRFGTAAQGTTATQQSTGFSFGAQQQGSTGFGGATGRKLSLAKLSRRKDGKAKKPPAKSPAPKQIVEDTLIYGTSSANRVDPDGAVSSGSTLFVNTSNHVTMRVKLQPPRLTNPKEEDPDPIVLYSRNKSDGFNPKLVQKPDSAMRKAEQQMVTQPTLTGDTSCVLITVTTSPQPSDAQPTTIAGASRQVGEQRPSHLSVPGSSLQGEFGETRTGTCMQPEVDFSNLSLAAGENLEHTDARLFKKAETSEAMPHSQQQPRVRYGYFGAPHFTKMQLPSVSGAVQYSQQQPVLTNCNEAPYSGQFTQPIQPLSTAGVVQYSQQQSGVRYPAPYSGQLLGPLQPLSAAGDMSQSVYSLPVTDAHVKDLIRQQEEYQARQMAANQESSFVRTTTQPVQPRPVDIDHTDSASRVGFQTPANGSQVSLPSASSSTIAVNQVFFETLTEKKTRCMFEGRILTIDKSWCERAVQNLKSFDGGGYGEVFLVSLSQDDSSSHWFIKETKNDRSMASSQFETRSHFSAQ